MKNKKDKMNNVGQWWLLLQDLNLYTLLIVLVSFMSCSGQVKQKEMSNDTVSPAIGVSSTIDSISDVTMNQLKDGKKEGLWRTYHKNGKMKSEGSYNAGLKEGLHKEWDGNGVLSEEGLYENGKANGLMQWFHEKGQLAGSGNMVDDVREGPWEICDIQENGFCIDAFFKQGKRNGVWKIYHEDARDKVWKEQTFKDDMMVSEKCRDKNGEEIKCEE